MKKRGSLTVVIPAFNEENYLGKTLKSVFKAVKSYHGRLDVVVVDNNSTDRTAEIARKSGATVVFEPKNQIARARNAGAAVAKGKYLVFLDADTTVRGDVFNKVENNLSSGKVIGGGAWVEPDSGLGGKLIFKYLINRILSLKNVTVGPFLYCERAAFEKVGGFNEELYTAEEFSLAESLMKEGEKNSKKWKIIKYGKKHRLITSARRFGSYGGLEMFRKNAHLIWNTQHKIREKEHCRFWYEDRK
ncbi:MAG: glycosyltransferase [bacterium]|nr:glycosyltransferase [bacterium]